MLSFIQKNTNKKNSIFTLHECVEISKIQSQANGPGVKKKKNVAEEIWKNRNILRKLTLKSNLKVKDKAIHVKKSAQITNQKSKKNETIANKKNVFKPFQIVTTSPISYSKSPKNILTKINQNYFKKQHTTSLFNLGDDKFFTSRSFSDDEHFIKTQNLKNKKNHISQKKLQQKTTAKNQEIHKENLIVKNTEVNIGQWIRKDKQRKNYYKNVKKSSLSVDLQYQKNTQKNHICKDFLKITTKRLHFNNKIVQILPKSKQNNQKNSANQSVLRTTAFQKDLQFQRLKQKLKISTIYFKDDINEKQSPKRRPKSCYISRKQELKQHKKQQSIQECYINQGWIRQKVQKEQDQLEQFLQF